MWAREEEQSGGTDVGGMGGGRQTGGVGHNDEYRRHNGEAGGQRWRAEDG